MPRWDEHTCTEEEWIAAFAIVLPPERAREEGLAWQAADVPGPRSYDGDWLLDLLSLVSDSCAERAWSLMEISRHEGERRRAEFRRRVEDALRARDER
jgi:hypothetical protein